MVRSCCFSLGLHKLCTGKYGVRIRRTSLRQLRAPRRTALHLPRYVAAERSVVSCRQPLLPGLSFVVGKVGRQDVGTHVHVFIFLSRFYSISYHFGTFCPPTRCSAGPVFLTTSSFIIITHSLTCPAVLNCHLCFFPVFLSRYPIPFLFFNYFESNLWHSSLAFLHAAAAAPSAAIFGSRSKYSTNLPTLPLLRPYIIVIVAAIIILSAPPLHHLTPCLTSLSVGSKRHPGPGKMLLPCRTSKVKLYPFAHPLTPAMLTPTRFYPAGEQACQVGTWRVPDGPRSSPTRCADSGASLRLGG